MEIVKKEPGESTSYSAPVRLNSLRTGAGNSIIGSSSLTLGGVQKVRFAPKAPARRIVKQEPAKDKKVSELLQAGNSYENYTGRSDDYSFRGRGMDRGRGRGRGRGRQAIQVVSGPFAMGPASLGLGTKQELKKPVKTKREEEGNIVWQGSMRPSSSVSTKKENENREQEEMEADVLDSDDEYGITEEEKKKMAPVVLLTDQNATEQGIVSDLNNESAENILSELENVVDLLQETNNYKDLMIWQFPEEIPEFKPHGTVEISNNIGEESLTPQSQNLGSVKADIKPNVSENKNSTSEVEAENIKNEQQEDQKDSAKLEGQVGEVLVHKSGKVTLVYGGVKMDLVKGVECQFAQQLVALDSDAKQLFSLGEVKNRIICIPDIDDLFSNLAVSPKN
ncbi:DNA-directed RNA polymerase III subunit RPC4 [Smittium culicis]|uniref:DNA-directed RNA polymerase III subunit RPC4 n=1 Tax=Smittium culicis TaxID=133412 RepID=A0A1R1WZF1_9FUNG|nr:DNA-directed RNA polymerase III subunit RPC4 [Smittium culicis]